MALQSLFVPHSQFCLQKHRDVHYFLTIRNGVNLKNESCRTDSLYYPNNTKCSHKTIVTPYLVTFRIIIIPLKTLYSSANNLIACLKEHI